MKNKEPEKEVLGMAAFDVKTTSEEGIKVEIALPDGTETGNFLIVRGADSPTFRKAQARTNRKLLDLQKKSKSLDPGDMIIRQEKLTSELVASLVADWNFEEECNIKNVSGFFEKAPQVMEQVDQVAGQRHHFFVKPLTVSKLTPEKSSGLIRKSKRAKSQTESISAG